MKSFVSRAPVRTKNCIERRTSGVWITGYTDIVVKYVIFSATRSDTSRQNAKELLRRKDVKVFMNKRKCVLLKNLCDAFERSEGRL